MTDQNDIEKHRYAGNKLRPAEYEALNAHYSVNDTLNDMRYYDGSYWVRATPAQIRTVLSFNTTVDARLGALGASAYLIPTDALAAIKAYAEILEAAGYPVWVCDGTDDYDTAQDAFDSLGTGGGVVIFLPGNYTWGAGGVTVDLTSVDAIKISGYGAVINCSDASNFAITLDDNYTVSQRYWHGMRPVVEGMHFVGDANALGGLLYYDVVMGVIRDVTAEAFAIGDGVKIDGATNAEGNTIENFTGHGNMYNIRLGTTGISYAQTRILNPNIAVTVANSFGIWAQDIYRSVIISPALWLCIDSATAIYCKKDTYGCHDTSIYNPTIESVGAYSNAVGFNFDDLTLVTDGGGKQLGQPLAVVSPDFYGATAFVKYTPLPTKGSTTYSVNKTTQTPKQYFSEYQKVGANTTFAFGTAGRVYLVPIIITEPTWIDTMFLEIHSVSAGNVTMGLYPDDGSGSPETEDLILETASTPAPGIYRCLAITIPLTHLNPGVYWPAVEASDVTLETHRQSGFNTNTSTLVPKYYDRGGGYGALTDPCPALTANASGSLYVFVGLSDPNP